MTKEGDQRVGTSWLEAWVYPDIKGVAMKDPVPTYLEMSFKEAQ